MGFRFFCLAALLILLPACGGAKPAKPPRKARKRGDGKKEAKRKAEGERKRKLAAVDRLIEAAKREAGEHGKAKEFMKAAQVWKALRERVKQGVVVPDQLETIDREADRSRQAWLDEARRRINSLIDACDACEDEASLAAALKACAAFPEAWRDLPELANDLRMLDKRRDRLVRLKARLEKETRIREGKLRRALATGKIADAFLGADRFEQEWMTSGDVRYREKNHIAFLSTEQPTDRAIMASNFRGQERWRDYEIDFFFNGTAVLAILLRCTEKDPSQAVTLPPSSNWVKVHLVVKGPALKAYLGGKLLLEAKLPERSGPFGFILPRAGTCYIRDLIIKVTSVK